MPGKQNLQQITRRANMLSAMGTESRLRIMQLLLLFQAIEVRRVHTGQPVGAWQLFRDIELLTMKQKREPPGLVAFITAQTGDDLVIAFAVCQPDDPTDIESLTILRTPKYEAFLDEGERGASVSFDRDLEGDERVLLREVVYAFDDKCITLRTDHHTYELDVRKVDPSELSAMCRVFRKMNFDSSIQLSGV